MKKYVFYLKNILYFKKKVGTINKNLIKDFQEKNKVNFEFFIKSKRYITSQNKGNSNIFSEYPNQKIDDKVFNDIIKNIELLKQENINDENFQNNLHKNILNIKQNIDDFYMRNIVEMKSIYELSFKNYENYSEKWKKNINHINNYNEVIEKQIIPSIKSLISFLILRNIYNLKNFSLNCDINPKVKNLFNEIVDLKTLLVEINYFILNSKNLKELLVYTIIIQSISSFSINFLDNLLELYQTLFFNSKLEMNYLIKSLILLYEKMDNKLLYRQLELLIIFKDNIINTFSSNELLDLIIVIFHKSNNFLTNENIRIQYSQIMKVKNNNILSKNLYEEQYIKIFFKNLNEFINIYFNINLNKNDLNNYIFENYLFTLINYSQNKKTNIFQNISNTNYFLILNFSLNLFMKYYKLIKNPTLLIETINFFQKVFPEKYNIIEKILIFDEIILNYNSNCNIYYEVLNYCKTFSLNKKNLVQNMIEKIINNLQILEFDSFNKISKYINNNLLIENSKKYFISNLLENTNIQNNNNTNIISINFYIEILHLAVLYNTDNFPKLLHLFFNNKTFINQNIYNIILKNDENDEKKKINKYIIVNDIYSKQLLQINFIGIETTVFNNLEFEVYNKLFLFALEICTNYNSIKFFEFELLIKITYIFANQILFNSTSFNLTNFHDNEIFLKLLNIISDELNSNNIKIEQIKLILTILQIFEIVNFNHIFEKFNEIDVFKFINLFKNKFFNLVLEKIHDNKSISINLNQTLFELTIFDFVINSLNYYILIYNDENNVNKSDEINLIYIKNILKNKYPNYKFAKIENKKLKNSTINDLPNIIFEQSNLIN